MDSRLKITGQPKCEPLATAFKWSMIPLTAKYKNNAFLVGLAKPNVIPCSRSMMIKNLKVNMELDDEI